VITKRAPLNLGLNIAHKNGWQTILVDASRLAPCQLPARAPTADAVRDDTDLRAIRLARWAAPYSGEICPTSSSYPVWSGMGLLTSGLGPTASAHGPLFDCSSTGVRGPGVRRGSREPNRRTSGAHVHAGVHPIPRAACYRRPSERQVTRTRARSPASRARELLHT
jgi:hypothetical protein